MVITNSAVSLPPPLWGRVGEGGSPGRGLSSWLPPSLPLPHKGGGNERAVPALHANSTQKLFNKFNCFPTVHGVVFELLSVGRHP
ncbi:hypothetical protein ACVWWO_005104 [Bradyrhizobium sp. F1.13.1]